MKGDWISTEKDLPEYGKLVIWHDTIAGMYVEAKKKSQFPLKKTITHWHELIFPDPPNR